MNELELKDAGKIYDPMDAAIMAFQKDCLKDLKKQISWIKSKQLKETGLVKVKEQ